MIAARPRVSAVCLAVLAAALPAGAQLVLPQKGETLPTFEAATVKPSRSDSLHGDIWQRSNTYRTENMPLRDLLREAFHTSFPAQLTGGPSVLLDARFDISAKIGDDDYAALQKLTRDARERTIHLMLEALFIDRFGLRYHMETRKLPVFDLVQSKGGAKLQSATQAHVAAASARPSAPAAPLPSPSDRARVGYNLATILDTSSTLAPLVATLCRQPEIDGRPVIDKTGLTGSYNYTLQWSPQHFTARATADSGDVGPSLFAALKEQLGLKLQPAKARVPIIVIDAITPPTPN